MPSLTKLAKSAHRTLCRCLATIILSFCGIASFGVISIGTSLLSSPVYATDSATSNIDITLNLGSAITLRILNSTASAEISELSFDFVPTATGLSQEKTAVVEVSTTNETGYTLFMESEQQDSNHNYTTSLINTNPLVSDVIPSSTNTSSFPFWYYENPQTSSNTVIPAHGHPDEIGSSNVPIDSDNTAVPITVGVDTSIVAGTYENTLLFTAVGNALPVAYTLSFDKNTTDTVTDLPSEQYVREVSASHTFTLPATEPSRAGYQFMGYSTDASSTTGTYAAGDTVTLTAGADLTSSMTLYAIWARLYTYTVNYNCNSGVDCPSTQTATTIDTSKSFTVPSSKPNRTQGYIFTTYSGSDSNTYAPSGTVNLTSSNNTITLSAQWQVAPFWTITNMQEMTPEVCASVYTPSNATGDAVTLVSDRADYNATSDGTPYVAQRSLYDIRDSNQYTIRKLADGNCWMTTNLKYSLTANSTGVGVNHSTNETFEFNTGDACETDGSCIMNGNTVMTERSTNNGYYYSWYAATAGTGTASMTSGDVIGSICPKGWRLPTNYSIDSTRSYGGLTQSYLGFYINKAEDHVATLEAVPISFYRAGRYIGGALNNPWYGYYWSSTVHSAGVGYALTYSTSLTYPGIGNTELLGLSVRCVAI